MSTIASRELRNHTADVLRRVADGDSVTITVNGEAVAELIPARESRRASLTKADVLHLLDRKVVVDRTLEADIASISADTTDDLDDLG